MTTTMNLLHYPDPYQMQSIIFLIAAVVLAVAFAISILYSKVTLAVISIVAIIGFSVVSTVFSYKSRDANIEHLQSWAKDNYSLTLNSQDATTLYSKGSLITEKNNDVEKVELERYKGGYLLFNDGKAIKQEN
jgi:predicted signal transduction protein with EAL and GGDEF domain